MDLEELGLGSNRTVTVLRVGENSKGKEFVIPPNWSFQQLIEAIGLKMCVTLPVKLFTRDGSEVRDIDLIQNDDMLYIGTRDMKRNSVHAMHPKTSSSASPHGHRHSIAAKEAQILNEGYNDDSDTDNHEQIGVSGNGIPGTIVNTIGTPDPDSSQDIDEHIPNSNSGYSLNIGDRIGNYILGRFLGRGGFGEVRLATHFISHEEYALKFIRKQGIKDFQNAERMSAEIMALTVLRHPNLLHMYEVIDTQSAACYVMEYLPGGDLLHYILDHGELKEFDAYRYFQQLYSGVEYCHSQNIIHRDLKLENLLLTRDQKTLKIADFGLCGVIVPDVTDQHGGTRAYAAPELFRGKTAISPALDIWSMGVILYGMLFGRLPFNVVDASGAKTVSVDNIQNGRYSFPPGKVSGPCQDFISRMLTVSIKKRASLVDLYCHPWTNIMRRKNTWMNTESGRNDIDPDSVFIDDLDELFVKKSESHSSLNHDLASPTNNRSFKMNQSFNQSQGQDIIPSWSPKVAHTTGNPPFGSPPQTPNTWDDEAPIFSQKFTPLPTKHEPKQLPNIPGPVPKKVNVKSGAQAQSIFHPHAPQPHDPENKTTTPTYGSAHLRKKSGDYNVVSTTIEPLGDFKGRDRSAGTKPRPKAGAEAMTLYEPSIEPQPQHTGPRGIASTKYTSKRPGVRDTIAPSQHFPGLSGQQNPIQNLAARRAKSASHVFVQSPKEERNAPYADNANETPGTHGRVSSPNATSIYNANHTGPNTPTSTNANTNQGRISDSGRYKHLTEFRSGFKSYNQAYRRMAQSTHSAALSGSNGG